jgi:hypothetical protein
MCASWIYFTEGTGRNPCGECRGLQTWWRMRGSEPQLKRERRVEGRGSPATALLASIEKVQVVIGLLA